MAWTDVSTGDKVEAAHINDIHQALNGTVGKAQPMAFTQVDESATYALDVRNKDATNSLIARFRNAANEVVLSVVKEAVNTAKQIVSTVATGTAPFVVNSTTKVDNLNADTVDGSHASAFAPTSHQDATTGVHGVGASTVESAAGAQAKVDAHANLTNPHSATSSATANRLMLRDASGRSKVASPSAADDIARKDTVDAVSSALNTHKSSADHDGRYYTESEANALYAPITNGVTNGNSHDHAGGDGAQIGTAGMQPNSVDDTIVGNRVPQFYRRQGGSATDWSAGGTTSYTPGAVRMQSGVALVDSEGTITVTFPVAFSQPPQIVFGAGVGSYMVGLFQQPSATGFIAKVYTFAVVNPYFQYAQEGTRTFWLAIGPE